MEGEAMNFFYSHKERRKRKRTEVSSSSRAATEPNSSKAQGTPATFGIPEVSSPLQAARGKVIIPGLRPRGNQNQNPYFPPLME